MHNRIIQNKHHEYAFSSIDVIISHHHHSSSFHISNPTSFAVAFNLCYWLMISSSLSFFPMLIRAYLYPMVVQHGWKALSSMRFREKNLHIMIRLFLHTFVCDIPIYWLVVWLLFFIFPYIGILIIPIDFHIFQNTNQERLECFSWSGQCDFRGLQ